MLYDNIESLDTAINKLRYTLQAHRAYTGELLEDYFTSESGEAMKRLNGIDAVNNSLIEEFEVIAQTLTEIMKEGRG
jgi:hypothetical protein